MSTNQAIPPYGGSQPPHVPEQVSAPAAPTSGGRVRGLLGMLLVLLAIGAGGYWVWSAQQDHIDHVTAGDCVKEAPGDENPPYRIVPCEDPAAAYKALQLIPTGTTNNGCREVAGASLSVTIKDATVCLGEKDVDPAKAVNVAKAGDCLSLQGSEPQRIDCSAEGARYKVLKRLEGVLSIQTRGACRNVRGAVSTYTWNWESNGKFGNVSRMNVDVLFCLGKN